MHIKETIEAVLAAIGRADDLAREIGEGGLDQPAVQKILMSNAAAVRDAIAKARLGLNGE